MSESEETETIKDGESYFTCGHTYGRYYLFSLGYLCVTIPDGTHIEARWLLVCPSCFLRWGGIEGIDTELRKPKSEILQADGVWKGPSPLFDPTLYN